RSLRYPHYGRRARSSARPISASPARVSGRRSGFSRDGFSIRRNGKLTPCCDTSLSCFGETGLGKPLERPYLLELEALKRMIGPDLARPVLDEGRMLTR